jgi:hypothetical protein
MSDETPPLLIEIQWHAPDLMYAAALWRDGEPWFLDGALVGMAASRVGAVDELIAAARHLVIEGENYLTEGQIPLADRQWLFRLLDPGDTTDDMYAALRQAEARQGENQ